MPNGDWFYARNNQQQGPVTLPALQDMARSGQLQPTDLVWREGMPNWLAAQQVAELFAPQPAAFPPAAPQGQWQAGPPSATPPSSMPYYGGAPVAYGATGKSYNGMAIGSFVCSLVGLLFCGVVLGIVAISLGVSAMNGMKTSGNSQGRGLSIAGVVIGVVDILAGIVIVLVMVGRAAHPRGGF